MTNETSVKVFETEIALKNGADEIDVVLNIGALKSENFDWVVDDLKAVVQSAGGKPVKVILECCLLDDRQKARAAELAVAAGASFVKTSTGFSKSGATAEDVTLLRSIVGPKIGVKASGGIRNFSDARILIEAGANRLGTSRSVDIIDDSATAVTDIKGY